MRCPGDERARDVTRGLLQGLGCRGLRVQIVSRCGFFLRALRFRFLVLEVGGFRFFYRFAGVVWLSRGPGLQIFGFHTGIEYVAMA